LADPQPVSIPEILSALLKRLERSLAERNVKVVRQIDPTTPELQMDRQRLQQVLETLLAEAATGTVEGGRVRVCLKHNAGAIMISIKDQGTGLAPGEWEKRLEDAGRAPVPGAPLALSRCRDEVAALRGVLFANSREDKGSTYYLVLSLPKSH
jgi:signal transduction histidine kinase